MSLSIGIVGLPNVGKSTLFNALTKNQVLAANYPFATIEPNVGIVSVPDERLKKLAEISGSKNVVPATVSFTDIAGLVRGAAQGAGLGNKFLSHVRECAAVVQVVRAFGENDVVHVEGSVDPKRDIATIRTELCLADLVTVQNRLARLTKDLKSNPKAHLQIQELESIKAHLDRGELISQELTTIPESLNELNLLTAKPFIYVFNLDEKDLTNTELKAKLSSYATGSSVCFVCASLEAQLAEITEHDRIELLRSVGQDQAGLVTLAHLSYKTLHLQSFYTSGEKESRAWTIHVGDSAPQAAGVIHTDFERGFIKADVVSYQAFIDHDGWNGSRAAGFVRLQGRDYIMQPDDIVEFKFNV